MATSVERQSLAAQRLALVQLAVTLLGEALITRHDRTNFTVHEIAGGLYHVVERDGKLQCTTCGEGLAGQDRHAALILLYVLALEGGRVPRRE
jgi:hypothetical protein